MTKLDVFIEKLRSDFGTYEAMHDLLDQLLKARESMQNPADAEAAEQVLNYELKEYMKRIMSKIPDNSERTGDPKYMEDITTSVEKWFALVGWSNYSKRSRASYSVQYDLNFSIENTSIRVSVFVEDSPKRIRIYATLPFIGEKTYEYLLSEAIVDANNSLVYGAFSYNPNNGAITYKYSYPVTHGFYSDDFFTILRAVLHTAVDDKAFSPIKKAAQGRYKRAEREMILKKLAPLVEDLTD